MGPLRPEGSHPSLKRDPRLSTTPLNEGGVVRGTFFRMCRGEPLFVMFALALVQVVPQNLRPRGVAELGHGLGFDLPDALTRYAVNLADFV